jgi:hypothetical protein
MRVDQAVPYAQAVHLPGGGCFLGRGGTGTEAHEWGWGPRLLGPRVVGGPRGRWEVARRGVGARALAPGAARAGWSAGGRRRASWPPTRVLPVRPPEGPQVGRRHGDEVDRLDRVKVAQRKQLANGKPGGGEGGAGRGWGGGGGEGEGEAIANRLPTGGGPWDWPMGWADGMGPRMRQRSWDAHRPAARPRAGQRVDRTQLGRAARCAKRAAPRAPQPGLEPARACT